MKDPKQDMKGVFLILLFILALIFRQAPPEFLGDHKTIHQSVLPDINMIAGSQGPGWIPWMNQDDSKELTPVFQPVQNEIHHTAYRIIPLDFRFFFHNRSNPLLTDRPPPLFPA